MYAKTMSGRIKQFALCTAVGLILQSYQAVPANAQQDTAKTKMMPGMKMPATDTMPMGAMMAGALGISMERMGSGTTWIPDALMLPSRHFMAGSWMVMVHGF